MLDFVAFPAHENRIFEISLYLVGEYAILVPRTLPRSVICAGL